jgi:DNA polymerase V
VIGLIDCNSFYASCERVFRPDLKGKPIVVLSNNDGCIVAQSQEAKTMGIARGAPYHQNKAMLRERNVSVFSSNYALYQDISQRVMDRVNLQVPRMEVYSIDEAFMFFDPAEKILGLEKLITSLKYEVERCTGIPVSIGLGRTKTLAKVAERYSKKKGGLFILTGERETEILNETPVSSLWGIGRKKGEFLLDRGIKTALDFIGCDDVWVKKHLTVVTLYTLWELRGRPMITPELAPPPRKEIVSGITSKKPLLTLGEIKQAMAQHAQSAARKLARERAVCSLVSVSMNTNRFKDNFQYGYKGVTLSRPVAYPPDIIKAAQRAAEEIYQLNTPYIRTGVNLGGLEPADGLVGDLFLEENIRRMDERKRGLATVQQEMDERYGRGTLLSAATGLKEKSSLMNRDFLSPRYTTCWQELARVN